ncbi:MAG: hypothetical protein CMJ46_02930 [Planctomyces sp.]|nr:hypothetical protein [Planctomyces sp.]
MISKLRNRFSLPLLARELTQQAGRKSLYAARTALVLGMILWIWLAAGSRFSQDSTLSINNLGIGRSLLRELVNVLFIGVYVLVPLLTSGSIAREKENDSLQLLLLTRLGPWAIILEKYLSRVLPMLLFLFCALPVFAYLYSLGGITEDVVFSSFYLLVLAVLQLNALCLACSAGTGTTMSALVTSVVIALGVFACPVTTFLFPPLLNWLAFDGRIFNYGTVDSGWQNVFSVLMASIPIWISTGVFLILARWLLIRRSAVKTTNLIYVFFQKLDKVFNEWNKEMTGGIILIQDRNDLPEFEPVAWKETRKTAVGTARYLIRLLVALELPTLFFCAFLMTEGVQNVTIFYSFTLLLLGIAILILINKSSGLITQERMQQTLDVVLTTPLEGKDILLQKSRGVRKLWIILMIPLATVVVSKTLIINPEHQFSYLFLIGGFIAATAYFCIWLSIYIGLKQKRHIYAVMTTMGVIGMWCVSFKLVQLIDPSSMSRDSYTSFLMILSPVEVLRLIDQITEYFLYDEAFIFSTALGYIAYTVAMALGIRMYCLRQADRLLGRISDENSKPEGVPNPAEKSLQEEPSPA